MQTMRDKWTDERLDDLNAKVDRGFERIDGEIADLRAEMNARFDQMNARFEQMDARFEQMNARMDQRFDALGQRFESLYRTLLGFVGALIIALLASNFAS